MDLVDPWQQTSKRLTGSAYRITQSFPRQPLTVRPKFTHGGITACQCRLLTVGIDQRVQQLLGHAPLLGRGSLSLPQRVRVGTVVNAIQVVKHARMQT